MKKKQKEAEREQKELKMYEELMRQAQPERLVQPLEWQAPGDMFVQFTMFTDTRTPILSDHTLLISDSNA